MPSSRKEPRSPMLLRMIFYAITGVLLSSISWSTISHSAVTGDYVLSFILLGMMFYVVGQFCVDRWRPEDGPQDFHPTRLWKIPQTTTPGGLWLRVWFNTLLSIGVYSALASLLVLATTAQPPFMVLLGTLFLLRMPHMYWSMRGRYERVSVGSSTNPSRGVLTYRGGSQIDRRARWVIPIGMAILGAVLAGAGMFLI